MDSTFTVGKLKEVLERFPDDKEISISAYMAQDISIVINHKVLWDPEIGFPVTEEQFQELGANPVEPKQVLVDKRDPRCLENWPDAVTFGYHPNCCRFPKSCSAGDWELEEVEQPSGEAVSTPVGHSVYVNKKWWLVVNGVWSLDQEKMDAENGD